MLILPGGNALSDFRINKLIGSINDRGVDISTAICTYVHFANLSYDLTEAQHAQLEQLMSYSAKAKKITGATFKLIVIPRPGTISPWSSKATDILHNSGLTTVERVERGMIFEFEKRNGGLPGDSELQSILPAVHDRMTEVVITDETEAEALFASAEPTALQHIDILANGRAELERANNNMGLALSGQEINYLYDSFKQLDRNPTDVELMMFAQANSEHCRHKIFNADFTIDGTRQPHSLFNMIRQTHETNPGKVLSAYHDNAAVMQGYRGTRFITDNIKREYRYVEEDIHMLMKVETHNHPTAISPYPGAATGAGGEIRDEAATGRGARPKAGLTGFAVSNLKIPGFIQPWEVENGKPERIVSALDIMIEGPIGAASYNNEFGRPALCGYFRSLELQQADGVVRGYHKPIMLAGGYGMIRDNHVNKLDIPAGAKLIVLGGPAMLIGLGGGAASSMASGSSAADLDFASVQRDNAEMERRCQEVIDRCWAMADENPILSIHDVGAGGLSNAMPELVSACDRGANLELRDIPNDEPGMSPMGIWCNESQERYVLAIAAEKVAEFEQLCQRERAPFAILGEATGEQQLRLNDSHFNNQAIDMPMAVLLGKMPVMQREVQAREHIGNSFYTRDIDLQDAIQRILQLPGVASKQFLITIGDRSVSGLVVRDQMVGPYQVPVADCAVTSLSYHDYTGEAMAVGERTPLALVNAPASGRMAVAEALLNICAARILQLDNIVLSANWMAACGEPGQDAELYATVAAVTKLCKELGIAIPVGKDSLSMNTVWQEKDKDRQVTAPLSLNISAFARVADVRQSLTPELKADENCCLLFIDLAQGRYRLGGSALCQVYQQSGDEAPDVDDVDLLTGFFQALQILNESDLILAYHDRSDGGLFVTLAEMAFAGHVGIDITCPDGQIIDYLFNEELGAVLQINDSDLDSVKKAFVDAGIHESAISIIAKPNDQLTLSIKQNEDTVFSSTIASLQQRWAETSYRIQSLRDNPDCANSEFELIEDASHSGLFMDTNFELHAIPAPTVNTGSQPKIAILREQGVNGQVEMAAAFDRAGFSAIDVHMQDLINGDTDLEGFHGLVACGGFSYGDVLGAGGGWARTILNNGVLTDMFSRFFTRDDTIALGVCNGCQMMSQLQGLIPGTQHWPAFVRNESEQFEARLVMVEIMDSPSVLFQGMAGSRLPVVVAHGEGRIHDDTDAPAVMRFIDSSGKPTERYPLNPNGSRNGLTSVTSEDGRFTIMMPHPERVFLSKQFSWLPAHWQHEYSPWMQIFLNARRAFG